MESKKQSQTEAPKIYFHGFPIREEKGLELTDRYLVHPKPVLVEGTGDTKIDQSDVIDLEELIQSYKDQCGVEFMQKQLKLGLVTPAQLADDGQHSGDASLFGADPLESHLAAQEATKAKAALCEQLGLNPDETTEEAIKAKIEEIYKKAEEAQHAPAEGVNNG